MKKLLCILLLVSFSAHGVLPVSKGDPAPGPGYYITPDEEKGFRKINEEKLTLQDLQVHQEQKGILQEERIKSYQQYVDQQKQLGPWQKTGYVAAGVIGTTLILFLATSVVKSAGK